MAILYVASESFELECFANHLTGLRKLNWPISYAFEGILEGRRIMLVANGAGPRLAARAVEVAFRAVTAAELSASQLEAVLSVGLCGALQPALKERQIVVGTEVLNVETDERFACTPVETPVETASGAILTQNRIANDAVEKRRLASTGSLVVEMEAAAVAARTQRAGLPFSCVKVVLDTSDESFSLDFNAMRDAEGRVQRGKIGFYAVTHPARIPDMLRLRRRSKDAAEALGDFLVSCRIKFEQGATHAE